MKRLRARLWLVLIAAAVLFIGGAALHGYGIRRHFERGAVAVEATVTAVETRHHEGYYTRVRPSGRSVHTPPRTDYTIRYTYDAEGMRYEGSHTSTRVRPRIRVGSRIMIEYAADKPSLSRLRENE